MAGRAEENAAVPSAPIVLPLRSSTCSRRMLIRAGEKGTRAAGVKQFIALKQVSPVSACNAEASWPAGRKPQQRQCCQCQLACNLQQLQRRPQPAVRGVQHNPAPVSYLCILKDETSRLFYAAQP